MNGPSNRKGERRGSQFENREGGGVGQIGYFRYGRFRKKTNSIEPIDDPKVLLAVQNQRVALTTDFPMV